MRNTHIHVMAVVALATVLSSCARRAGPVQGPKFDAASRAFHQGLTAFEEFTPDGYARAIALFRRASELDRKNCAYRLHLAQAGLFLAYEQQLNGDDYALSFAQGATPACAAPESSFALRLQAFRGLQGFRQSSPRNTALELIEKAIALDPDDPMNLYVHWKVGPGRASRDDNAILIAQRLAPNLAIIQYEAGTQLRATRELEHSRVALERAIQLSPRHFRSYLELARTMVMIDEDYDAEPLYRRVVEIAPGFVEGRFALGDYYAAMSEVDLAAGQYRGALNHNPRLVAAHLRLAFLYLQAQRLDEAEKAALDAIAIEPQAYEAYYCLGNVRYERGDLNRAQAEYQRALGIVPIYPEAMYGLGTVHFDKGEHDSAVPQFDLVIRYMPNHANAYFSRALIRAERNETKEAIEDCDNAIRHYQNQMVIVRSALAKAESRGHTRKAAYERARLERLEKMIDRVQQLKSKISFRAFGLNVAPSPAAR